jgi:hypothetical protein
MAKGRPCIDCNVPPQRIGGARWPTQNAVGGKVQEPGPAQNEIGSVVRSTHHTHTKRKEIGGLNGHLNGTRVARNQRARGQYRRAAFREKLVGRADRPTALLCPPKVPYRKAGPICISDFQPGPGVTSAMLPLSRSVLAAIWC